MLLNTSLTFEGKLVQICDKRKLKYLKHDWPLLGGNRYPCQLRHCVFSSWSCIKPGSWSFVTQAVLSNTERSLLEMQYLFAVDILPLFIQNYNYALPIVCWLEFRGCHWTFYVAGRFNERRSHKTHASLHMYKGGKWQKWKACVWCFQLRCICLCADFMYRQVSNIRLQ